MDFKGVKIDPELVRKLNYQESIILAANLREEIIKTVSTNGGHLSSNLGVVELVLGLFRNFDCLNDDIVFDVGHQTYAYKIITGRDITNIRKKSGIHPFSDLDESPYDKCSNGHSSTSLSIALGLARAKKIRHDPSYTVAFIGDASIVNGMSFEALNLIGLEENLNLVIILNDNGMGISKSRGSIATTFQKIRKSHFYINRSLSLKKLGNYKATRWLYVGLRAIKDAFKRLVIKDTIFESLNINYNGPFDGNKLKEVDWALSYAKKVKRPMLLHFLTQKGQGYELAKEDHTGSFHGVEPFLIGDNLKSLPGDNFTRGASKLIYSILEEDPAAYLLCPAMVLGSDLVECFRDFPSRTEDVGIAEEHAVTTAAGLALGGLHPIISIYSTFLQRSYDQLLHDLSRMKINALIFVERAGLVGPDGSSHQGIFDVAFLKTIPNVEIFQPVFLNDLEEIKKKYYSLSSDPHILAVRLPRDRFKQGETGERLSFINGSKKALVGVGKLGYDLLNQIDGFDGFLVKDLFPIKTELIADLMGYESVTIYDPYSTKDGFSSSLVLALTEAKYHGTIDIHSISSSFVDTGSIGEQLVDLCLDLNSMKEKLK